MWVVIPSDMLVCNWQPPSDVYGHQVTGATGIDVLLQVSYNFLVV
jgi:hypothetical protein